MSVIVFDGQGTIAADSLANGPTHSFPYPKVVRLEASIPSLTDQTLPQHTILAGVVGPLQASTQLLNWLTQGLAPSTFPYKWVAGTNAQLITVTKEEGLKRYNGQPIPHLHGLNKFAIGEGAPFAYGALYMGATAEQAVAAAIHYSPDCNGEVVSLSL